MGCHCAGTKLDIQEPPEDLEYIPPDQRERINAILSYHFGSLDDPGWDRSYDPPPTDWWSRTFKSTA